MRIYTFEKNKNGKIELTQEEFEKMLENAYNEGVKDGESKGVVYYPWVYPTYPTHERKDWTISTQPNTNPYRINCTTGVTEAR